MSVQLLRAVRSCREVHPEWHQFIWTEGRLAGLLGVPTISVHSHLPPEFLFSRVEVTSLTPDMKCTACRWQPDRGYITASDTGCSALGSVSPERVLGSVSVPVPLSRGSVADVGQLGVA